MRTRVGLTIAVATAILTAVAGCGGSGGSSGGSANRAGFSMTIKWPTARTIPSVTTRLHLTITQDGVPVPGASQDVERPTDGKNSSTIVFNDLPVGVPLNFQVEAFAPDGPDSVALVGTVLQTVRLQSGMNNVVVLDLQSTIDHLTVSADKFVNGTLRLVPGEEDTLVVAAQAAGGGDAPLVPFDPKNLTYTATGSGFTVVNGLVHATGRGSGTITIRESDSGKSIDVPVVVGSSIARIEVGSANSLSLINHQAIPLAGIAKAFNADGQEVPATFTYEATGSAITVSPDGLSLRASVSNAAPEGEVGTGTLTVTADGVAQTAQVHVQAHGAVKTLTLNPNRIDFNFLFFDATLTDGTTPDDDSDFELTATDAFGNSVPLSPTEISWSIPESGTSAGFVLTNTSTGANLDASRVGTASTTLTATDLRSGVKVDVPVKSTGT